MSEFGNQYIPSLAAVTGFETAAILKDLAHNRENQIENVKSFQSSQLSATQNLAAATENTLMQQADSEEDSAQATLLQGGIGLGAPIVSTAYQGYRTDFAQDKISNMKLSMGSERTELGQINFESDNLNQWKTVLRNGSASVQSAGADIPMDVFADHSPNQASDEELDALRRKNFGATRPDQDPDKAVVESLKQLRGGAKADEDPDPIKQKQLYKDVEKKIDDQEQSLQSKRQRYDNHTDLVDRKWESVFSSLSYVVSGKKQEDAAAERREQAEASSIEQYAKYVSDSNSQNVQTATKVYDDINQAQQQASQAYFADLGRANQPV